MKKLIVLSVFFAAGMQVFAQTTQAVVSDIPSAMVYFLPKTELKIKIVAEKTTQTPGVFYRYSERYLATRNVITSEKTNYRIKSISLVQSAIPDSSKMFSFVPTTAKHRISVNEKGIISGINVTSRVDMGAIQVESTASQKNESSSLLGLGEEYMMAGSEAKMAEGAAKQIYRIRESRLSLITADVEKMPADGASLQTMLRQLDSMETELTSLFIGKSVSEDVESVVSLVPDKPIDNQVIFRFSSLLGLVRADDLSGAPYFISVLPASVHVNSSPKAIKAKTTGIYYVLPASTQVTVRDGLKTVAASTFYVPQFGQLMQLPEVGYFKSQSKLTFDTVTGRLLSVE